VLELASAHRSQTAVIAAVLLAGLAERVVVWTSSLGRLDGDEAVWGLMATAVRHGHFAAFYWAQAYGGTLEAIIDAPVLWALGGGTLALRLPVIAMWALGALLVWRLGLRVTGRIQAAAAGALFWLWPAYNQWKSLRAHGFYASGIVLTLLVLLLVLRVEESRSRRDVALLGLVCGVAFWQTPQLPTVALPALLWLVARRPGVIRWSWLFVPAAALGAAPWLASNLEHRWWSIRGQVTPGNTGLHTYLAHLRAFFTDLLPMLLGLRVPFELHWFAGPLGMALYLACLIGFAVQAWRLRKERISLLFAVAIGYPFVYALSRSTWLTDEPRYLVLLSPVVCLLLAHPLRSALRAVLAGIAAVGLSAVVLVLMAGNGYRNRADGAFVPTSFAPLIAELDCRHIRRMMADYWVAYTVAFLTNERVIAAEGQLDRLSVRGGAVVPRTPTTPRRRSYSELVARDPRRAVVYVPGDPLTGAAASLFARNGYHRVQAGRFTVFVKRAPTSSAQPPAGAC